MVVAMAYGMRSMLWTGVELARRRVAAAMWPRCDTVVIRGAPVLTMTVVVTRGASVFRAVGAWLDVVVPGLGVRTAGVVPGGP